MYLESEGNMLSGRFHFLRGDVRCSKTFGSVIPADDTITFTLTSLKFYTGSGITVDLAEGNSCDIEDIGGQDGDEFYLGVR